MSKQQDAYLALRAAGATVILASIKSSLPIGEAHLLEKDVARGEVAMPAPIPSRDQQLDEGYQLDGLKLPIPAAGQAVQSKEVHVAKKTQPGDGVTNLSETKDIVRNAVPKIVGLKERRKAINEEIASIREQVNAAGVPKKALDHAIRVKEMDPDDRQRFDEGYAIARDAIGLKMSSSLFDMIETPTEPANETADETADAAA